MEAGGIRAGTFADNLVLVHIPPFSDPKVELACESGVFLPLTPPSGGRSEMATDQVLMERLREPDVIMTSSRAVQALQSAEIDWLRAADDALASLALDDKAEFCRVIGMVIERLGRADVIAAAFGASEATLSRWKSGESAPHPYARQGVVERFQRLLRERITLIETELAEAA